MTRGGLRLGERLRLAPLYPGARRLLLSAALGAASVLGFAPFYLFPVPVLTLAALVWMWRSSGSAGQSMSLGLAFGAGHFYTGASWVYVSMHDFGGMAWPVAGFATWFFCTYLALFPALVGWLFGWSRAADWAKLLLLFPAAWAVAEWMRGWLFTGFPWLALGYSQSPFGPLSGYAPVLGVYGVSLLTALSAGLLCLALGPYRRGELRAQSRPRRALTWPAFAGWAALWLLGWGLQHVEWTTPSGPPVSVSLVQGNIKQDMKWRPEWLQRSLETYLGLTLIARGTLILLPETAVPLFSVDVPAGYLDALARRARDKGGDLLLGIPEYIAGRPPRYYNSIISLGTESTQTYRKYHLVPFGDYFPHWGFLTWIMNALQIPMSDFSRGDPIQQPLRAGGQRVAANICYEDVFGEEIIRQLPQATLLANFTNDAWWGESIASVQHLQIAQMRSQETGRYMLRATNTGVTAIIDQRGRVTRSAPQFVPYVLEGGAQGYTGSTPFIFWGNWPFLALSLTGLSVPLVWRSRRA